MVRAGWGNAYSRSLSSTTSGAWSLGRSFLRGSLSITQPLTPPFSASLTRVWLMRRPWLLRKARLRQSHQAQANERAEVLAFFGRAQDLPGPGHRIVDVAVFGRDVEVAHQHQPRVRRQLRAQPIAQRLQPAHLVLELVAVRCLPVGQVLTDDSQGARVPARRRGR